MKYVLHFSDAAAADVSSSGGKGASLARLTQAGFPVPPGFVISPQAYRDATGAIAPLVKRMKAMVNDTARVEKASAEIVAAHGEAWIASGKFASLASLAEALPATVLDAHPRAHLSVHPEPSMSFRS